MNPVLVAHRVEGLGGHAAALLGGQDLVEVGADPVLVVEGVALARRLVLEHDGEPLMEVRLGFEACLDELSVEADLREDLPVGMKLDRGTAAACARLDLLQLGGR